MPAAAAIDIGSNGVRLAIAAPSDEKPIERLGSWRESVRLGKDVFADEKISETSIHDLEQALLRFKDICREFSVEKIRVVATAALREAKNQRQVIKSVKRNTGLQIETISAEEEARLVFLAVAAHTQLKEGTALLIDIGGGSVEFSLVQNGELIRSETAPMGALRMLKLFEERNNSPKLVDRLVREYARGIKQQFINDHRKYKIERCYGTGGNIEALGQLRKILFGKSESDRITFSEIAQVLEKLQGMSVQERIDKLGLRPDRADVLFPATAVIHQLLLESHVEELLIPGVGLKDGILIEELSLRPYQHENRRQALFDYGTELGRRYDFHEQHGKTVARLAREIFLQTGELHQLPPQYLTVLELSALLHDIGQFVSYPSHHKHSYYLLLHSTFIGLQPWEQQLVASVARYHRKSFPKPQHPSSTEVREEDAQALWKLSSILRLADAMDRQHQDRVKSVAIKQKRDAIELIISGQGDLLLECWAVKKKAEMFEQVFQLPLSVESTGAL